MTVMQGPALARESPPSVARLFAAWTRTGRADLDAHLETFGPLPSLARSNPTRPKDELLEEIRASGLTGRGGAGFPTAQKWSNLLAQRKRGVLVVNAMECEPASYKDRTLLSVAPHLVLDGAELAATVLAAREIVMCVADDEPDVTCRVRSALAERSEALTGAHPVRLLNPPGRYVAGEESALVSWVGRGPARPQFRVSKATPLTLAHRPVLVQSTETLAHVGLIARFGAHWFREVGTPGAPGTCLVTVTGEVRRTGVFEVTLGTPIHEILGARSESGAIGAVLLGGYGGTWIPGDRLPTPYEPLALRQIGAAVGAGVVAAVSPTTCGVAESARIATYMANMSAGQCGPCLYGLHAIADDLAALTRGHTDRRLLSRLRERLALVEGRGACGHPDGVVRFVRSALAVFAHDVSEHAKGRPCPRWKAPPVLPVPRSAHDAVMRRSRMD